MSPAAQSSDAAQDGPGESLRSSFSGLTTRGRSFLAAGAAAAVCSYVLGQTGLLRVGLLLAALPVVCVLVLHRAGAAEVRRVTAARELSPARVQTGAEARVRLRIGNRSRRPSRMLMLQDRVPYVLGTRPRFALAGVEPGGRRDVSYRVRSDLRGRYLLGPLQLRLTDPFGMCELIRAFSTHDTMTVVPRAEALPPGGLSGEAGGRGDGRQRALVLAGDDDIIPRGYRHGDDLRRVHWRSTARYGELMVRREEQPQKARCTVLLDTRRDAYAGSGPGSPFEWAVSGAASVALHLLERGCAVRLLTDTGAITPGPESGSFTADTPHTAGLLLDALAVVEHSAEADLGRAYEMLRRGGTEGEGLLIAFLGELDEDTAVAVGRMRPRTHAAAAFLSGPDPHPPAMQALRDAGWDVLPGGPERAFPELWQEAGQSAVKGLER